LQHETPLPVTDERAPEAAVQAPAGADDLAVEYEFLGELGRGGAAVVHRARNRRSGREVAIKLIRSPLATDADTLNRFAREARTAALLQHPNIVSVYGVRRLRYGGLALIMEYVRGGTLKQRIQQHAPLPADDVRRTVRQIARALQCAHRHGIVHRDVKPENIFLEEGSGRALLADFGIARTTETGSGLTLDGFSLGTPAYMAPEQIDGEQVDGRADLYSLALVAWEMLTGDAPWEGSTLYGVIYSQKHHRLPSVTDFRSDVPQALIDVIARGAEKEPGDRFPDADSMLRALDAAPAALGWRQRLLISLARPRREPAPTDADEDRFDEVERLVEQASSAAPPPTVPGETIRFRREKHQRPPHDRSAVHDGQAPASEDDPVDSRPLEKGEQERRHARPVSRRGTTAHSPPLLPARAPREGSASPTVEDPQCAVGGAGFDDPSSEPERAVEVGTFAMPTTAEPLLHRSASQPDGLHDAAIERPPAAPGDRPAPARRSPLFASLALLLVIGGATWGALASSSTDTAADLPDIGARASGSMVRTASVVDIPDVVGSSSFVRSGTGADSPPLDGVPVYPCARDASGSVRCGALRSDEAGSAFHVDAGELLGLRCRVPDGGVALCVEEPRFAPAAAHRRTPVSPGIGGALCTLLSGTDGGCWRDAGHAVLAGDPETMPSIAVWVPWTRPGGAAVPQVRHEGDGVESGTAEETGF
jgi:serine/threonine protein kinase